MISQENELQKAFEYVRKTYFPRWDKGGEWSVQLDPGLRLEGECIIKEKKIKVQSVSNNKIELYHLLIHEICHTSALGHKKKWLNRMLKKAEIAERVGELELSISLKNEVDSEINADYPTPNDVYNNVVDWVNEAQGDASYEYIIYSVAKMIGFMPHELEERYKECRKVYDEAVKNIKEFYSRNEDLCGEL
ncbi:hypothetical protein JXQ70_00985 [bacterium]|nr:hypothetical protein [bacterium]